MQNTDLIVKDLHAEAALLLKEKETDEAIIDHLMQKGIERYYAEMVLENAKSDHSDQKTFYKLLFSGCTALAGGIMLTVGTYQMTIPGGIYFIFYGLMVSGVVSIVRAFLLFRK